MKTQLAVAALATFTVLLLPARGYAQAPDPRSGPSTPVQVTNTTSNPVPVTIQGNTTVTLEGSVTTSAADTTETVIAQFITVTDPFDGNHIIGPVSIKQYKSIRIVANRGSCIGCADPVRVRVISRGTLGGTTIANQLDTFLLDTPNGGVGKSASREYDVAGENLLLSFSNPAAGSTNEVAVLVFGRKN